MIVIILLLWTVCGFIAIVQNMPEIIMAPNGANAVVAMLLLLVAGPIVLAAAVVEILVTLLLGGNIDDEK